MLNNFTDVIGFSTIADVGFPPQVCSTVFLRGCNFRCPYCINRDFLGDKKSNLNIDEILTTFWFRREKKVVVSGGEPFINENIDSLFEKIKRKGMEVAVATNGSFPEKMISSIKSGLVDHVIMDIKTGLNKEKYSRVAGRNLSDEEFQNIVSSIDFLKKTPRCALNTEFRTTVCAKFVSKEDIFSIASYLGMGNVYFLQPFAKHQTLDQELSKEEYVVQYEELKAWAHELDDFVVSACFVRDV